MPGNDKQGISKSVCRLADDEQLQEVLETLHKEAGNLIFTFFDIQLILYFISLQCSLIVFFSQSHLLLFDIVLFYLSLTACLLIDIVLFLL
jgi:hypothetical protein